MEIKKPLLLLHFHQGEAKNLKQFCFFCMSDADSVAGEASSPVLHSPNYICVKGKTSLEIRKLQRKQVFMSALFFFLTHPLLHLCMGAIIDHCTFIEYDNLINCSSAQALEQHYTREMNDRWLSCY